eukprot:symbB.v1.2.011869.t1/scaffold805.1/size161038/3
MVSPVERFSPSPLDSPRRPRQRPFAISTRPNAERLSLRPWRQGPGFETFDAFDGVAFQPVAGPTQVPPKANVKMRSVEQWLRLLMPKVAKAGTCLKKLQLGVSFAIGQHTPNDRDGW